MFLYRIKKISRLFSQKEYSSIIFFSNHTLNEIKEKYRNYILKMKNIEFKSLDDVFYEISYNILNSFITEYIDKNQLTGIEISSHIEDHSFDLFNYKNDIEECDLNTILSFETLFNEKERKDLLSQWKIRSKH